MTAIHPMRVLAAIAVATCLTGMATAQASDYTARDARLTCELLEDIIAPSSARGEGPVYVSRFFAGNPSNGPLRVGSLADFIRLQGEGNPWGVTPEWEAAFGQLRASMVEAAWTAWNAGGPVDCPDLTGVQWTTREAFEDVSRQAAAHYMGPPYPIYVEISRPAFDESGYRALDRSDTGTLTTIYELRDGHWQADAFNLVRPHFCPPPHNPPSLLNPAP